MTDFTIHDEKTAPEESRPLLEESLKQNGMIANMHGIMAEAPGLFKGYRALNALFVESSLTAEEITVVWQTINVEQNCQYCVPAHTMVAKRMKVDQSITDALRDEKPLDDPRLEALRAFTLEMVRTRGNLEEGALETFLDAGFTKRNALEVILGLAQKVISNYTNHIVGTPLDSVFESVAWEKVS